MAYCLKTGGVLWVKPSDEYFEMDAHIVGDSVVFVTCPPYSIPEAIENAKSRIFATLVDGHWFYRHHVGAPYGILVVPQIQVELSPAAINHVYEWYSYKPLRFLNCRTQ